MKNLTISLLVNILFIRVLFAVKNCKDGIENLSQGNVRLNSKSFKKFKTSNKLFVLAVSDSSCEKCCYSEFLIQNFIKEEKNNKEANVSTFN